MPEEAVGTDVKSALESLEHYCLKNHLARTQDYNVIHSALLKEENLSLKETERLLTICIHDLKEDIKYSATVMNIICAILSRVKKRLYDPCPDLLPSALAVIQIIKTAALLSKADSLKILCYDTLLSYPDDTLIAVAEHHDEIMEIFNLYCHSRITINMKLQACSVLYKLLKILPPEKKKVFVEEGVSVWFSKIVPTVMSLLPTSDCEMAMELLELLTDELIFCDYSDNQQWHSILECICNAKKYPEIMKILLQKGSGLWHRLWIVFIRLLKSQVTQSQGTIGTPINSMLPVVEAAFKVDVANRCKAFECWNVLIDSFSTETNESNINKRIKLLIIPLKSNNAKAEETALAKFKCWWHLLQKFQNKIDKFLDVVLVSFLHFCFGRHNSIDKSALIPGQISVAMKKLCIQAIVDVVGHVHCDGCTELPKLKAKIITTKNLVDNWNHWIYSLTSTIMMSANSDNGLTKQQMTCLWKSFLMTIGELPENNIRKDLFSEMLSIVLHLVQECKSNAKLADIVFNALLLSLFDEDIRIKQLLKTRNDINDPLYKILMALLDPSLNIAYESCNMKELVKQLRPVTDMILNPAFSAPVLVIGWLLKTLPTNDIALILWTALVESVWESKCEVCPQSLCNILLWPIKSINVFTDIKLAAMTWHTTYDLLYTKLEKTDIDKDISKFLFTTKDVSYPTTYFKLCIILGVIKQKLNHDNCTEFEKEVQLLQNLTSNIENYQSFEQLFPVLIDRVLALIKYVMSNVNETLTRHLLLCIKKMLTVMTQSCNEQSDASHVLSLIESILKPLDSLFKVESYSKLIPVIVDDLLECSSSLYKQSLIKSTLLSVMKTFLLKIVETDITFNKIKAIIDQIESDTNDVEKNLSSNKNKFTTPKANDVKRVKKKQTSIMNTVVENGEEYVVVKSNWKFNPRKLTENQKEKLQRKREDIPALYQDLSQSQDEFKLETWKTDSQDTSNSSRSESKSSKAVGNETATEILKNLPSSNVVPKMLETFFSENEKKDSINNAKELLPKNKVNKVEATTPKNTKSPRMALKDRVFRNVRNLIEKSEVQNENKDAPEDLNKTENIIKTPVQSKSRNSANIVNSAPPLLSADRPSRVKRKPKKFEELIILSAKKCRQSSQDLKLADKPTEPIIATSSSEIDTTKDVQIIEIDSAPIVSVTDNKEETKPNHLQLPAIEYIPDVIIQSNDNVQKKESEINNSTDINNEDKNIAVESKEHQTTCLDLHSSSESEKTDAKSNDEKDDKANDKKDDMSNDKKDDMSNDKKDEKSNDKKDDMSNDKKDDMSNDKNIAKSNDKICEMPDEKKKGKTCDKKDKNSDEKKIEKSYDKKDDKNVENVSDTTKDVKEVSTPQQTKNKESEDQKLTTKKNSVKKSRIEKELAIDTVEGHPFLKMQSQKRLTRKALESAATGRRKSLAEKLNKSKSEANSGTVKSDKKKEKSRESDGSNNSITVDATEDKNSESKDQISVSEDLPYSEDVIESSQDSSITTISVKSRKKTSKKVAVITLEKMKVTDKGADIDGSQSILDHMIVGVSESPSRTNQESKDDIELPLNKTVAEENTQDLTENMDTEPIDDKELSDVVIVINDDIPAPLTISSDESVGPETQEIAEADTQPTDPKDFMDIDVVPVETTKSLMVKDNTMSEDYTKDKSDPLTKDKFISETSVHSSDNTTITLSESACLAVLEKETGASSPSSFRDEALRKQDFMNNTLEISPIKNMSPDRNKKSPSPETSSDYVVIKLSSPVQSNGEPYEKCGSPEVFTEEKVSPDKRDQSPPRVEVTVTNTSPSSSLSLKKNRPQVRSGGRAAQMLGLCVPDKLKAIINPEKNETEEVKKSSASSTPARRNLRILYNSVSENMESTSENDDNENFLRFRRSLPAIDSSPSGPILKRKLIEISDDATVSPASKRKRVSFHDPPVSTTVSVQKYIEPAGVRSPQNSVQKRIERQLRQYTPSKSPKRLDHAFKLDTVLTKTIESFSETEVISTPDDTQAFSLDETPVVEIVRASELNDTDPICPDLLDCEDPIDNIASELSSSAMKSLLVKELVGKVETVGDLAKMTELEVNRLCIKAPKVKVAKKVLTDYASKRIEKPQCDASVTIDEAAFDEPMTEPDTKGVDMEVQTDRHESIEMEVQTVAPPTTLTFVQTETIPTVHTSVQTDDSGSKSTADIIKSCLTERPDFVEQVSKHLEESAIQQITEKLTFSAVTDVLMKKVTPSNSKSLLNRILEHCNDSTDDNRRSKELSFVRDYVCEKFDSQDLILFCSEVLKSVYDKPA